MTTINAPCPKCGAHLSVTIGEAQYDHSPPPTQERDLERKYDPNSPLMPFGKFTGQHMSTIEMTYWRWYLDCEEWNQVYVEVCTFLEDNLERIKNALIGWQPRFPSRLYLLASGEWKEKQSEVARPKKENQKDLPF